MLVQAGSDPKQMKLSFSNEINIINVYPRSLNEDKVTVSSEFEVRLIVIMTMAARAYMR